MAQAGYANKLYRSATLATDDTTAHYEGKTWIEATNVRDVTLNLETGEADITTRANNGWRQTMPTLFDGTIETEMIWDTGDEDFEAFRTAWLAKAEIAVAAMSGDITDDGQEGLAGNFYVTNFTRNEPLDDATTVSITLKPSSFNNWFVVGGS